MLEKILGITKTNLKKTGRKPISLCYVTKEEYLANRSGNSFSYKWGVGDEIN